MAPDASLPERARSVLARLTPGSESDISPIEDDDGTIRVEPSESNKTAVTASGSARWLEAYSVDGERPIWAGTPDEVTFRVPHDIAFANLDEDVEQLQFVVNGKPEKPIPYEAIRGVAERAPDDAEYVVVRSDLDCEYAETLEEASEIAHRFRTSIEFLAPVGHTVQVIELPEVPPES